MSGRGTLPARPPAASAAQMNAENAQTLPRAAPAPCATCPQEIVRIGIFFDGTGNNKEKDIATTSATNVAKLWTIYIHDEAKLARADQHHGENVCDRIGPDDEHRAGGDDQAFVGRPGGLCCGFDH